MEKGSATHLASVRCPICEEEMLLSERKESPPYFGSVLLSLFRCAKCGYNHRNAVSLEFKEPTGLVFNVTEPEDLKTRVVRSSRGTIKIPEIGVKIDAGPLAEGFISNIEGVLKRIQQAASILAKESSGSKPKKYANFLKRLTRARRGELKFNFILMDPLEIAQSYQWTFQKFSVDVFPIEKWQT